MGQRLRAAESGATAPREEIAVLGTGSFGATIGKRLAAIGYPVVFGSRTPDAERVRDLVKSSAGRVTAASQKDAVSRAAIIVFAVPWEPVKEMLPSLGDLSGKLIIDPIITKPKITEGYPFRPDPATSTAEQIKSWAPGAHIAKAFSTTYAKTLANPARAGGAISIPLAGTDPAARQRVAELVSELGYDPVDLGSLVGARYIEDMLWFEVACAMTNKRPFEMYIRPVTL
jgi:predicted dinucleotide-binding enzyme